MKKHSGFTLIELMITLAIASILLFVGLPSFDTFIKDGRLTSGVNDLVGALYTARSEAVKRGLRVSVCKSDDQASCASSGGWQQGWIVFTDENNSGDYDAGETVLRVHSGLSSPITAIGDANVSSYISYIGSGQSQQAGGGIQSGNIEFRDGRTGPVGKNLVMNTTGRLHTDSEVTVP